MVIFTCDKGKGGSGAVPGQLCSRTPTQGDTKSFSAAGQETQSFSLLPAGTTHSGLSWASSALHGVGGSRQRAQPTPKTEKAGGVQARATECLGCQRMAAWVCPAHSLGITATAAVACPAPNAFLALPEQFPHPLTKIKNPQWQLTKEDAPKRHCLPSS